MTGVKTYFGLGSNLGDRMSNLASAIECLYHKVNLKKLSSVYETEPVGYKEQPAFFNMVLLGMTSLNAFELLRFVKSIESALGRQPGFRNAPRPIDIDILFYADKIIDTPELTIPHPRIAERAFVLIPIAEIAPELVHPLLNKKVSDLLAELENRDGVRKLGKLRLGRKIE